MGFTHPNENEVLEHQLVTPDTWPGKIHVNVELEPRTSQSMGCGTFSLVLGSLLLMIAITWYAMDAGDHELLKIILGIAGGVLLGSVFGKIRISLQNKPGKSE